MVEEHQPLIGDAVVDDGAGLLFVVEKFPEVNTLAVTERVEDAIETMAPGLAGLEFDPTVYRPASFVEKSIDNLALALIIGAVLAALLVGAFLFRWRTALIALLVMPLSLVVAALMLYALGTTMNAIVLAGLVAALAVVIDDAVVGVENVTRRLRERGEDGVEAPIGPTVLEATLEVRGATVYATLIVALAVLPLFFLEGLAGAFFPDLAGAYLLALLASMVVALTVTPALCVLLLSRATRDRGDPPLVGWLQRGYESLLARVVHRPRITYVAAGAVLVGAFAAVPFLGGPLLPTFRETSLLVRWDGPPGTSLPEMNRITARASRELRSIPGVQNVGAHVGRAVTADQVVGVNSGELWVSLDPDADHDATVDAVRDVVDGYPGLSRDIQTYSNERVREALTGADEDVVVRVYGEDLDVLSAQAQTVRSAVSQVDGVATARVDLPAQEPTLEIEVDLQAAQREGIKPGDVRRAASTLLSGIQVGSLFEEQKVFDVVVWGAPEIRSSLTGIRQLLIDTPSGGHVRLGDVARVRIAANPANIKRHAVSRYVDVAADVSGRDRSAVVGDVEGRLQALAFPLEYHAEVLATETQPWSRLIAIGIAAAIGILLLLQACFGSWRLATLAFATLPLAVAGAFLAALAVDATLSFGAVIAVVAVFGIAARNTVLLVDRFRRLTLEEGEEAERTELVLRGARERFAPTVLTALATMLALLPMVVLGGAAGNELTRPLAVVVLGGLVTSTLVGLFVLPTLYARFGLGFASEQAPERPPDAVPAAELGG